MRLNPLECAGSLQAVQGLPVLLTHRQRLSETAQPLLNVVGRDSLIHVASTEGSRVSRSRIASQPRNVSCLTAGSLHRMTRATSLIARSSQYRSQTAARC